MLRLVGSQQSHGWFWVAHDLRLLMAFRHSEPCLLVGSGGARAVTDIDSEAVGLRLILSRDRLHYVPRAWRSNIYRVLLGRIEELRLADLADELGVLGQLRRTIEHVEAGRRLLRVKGVVRGSVLSDDHLGLSLIHHGVIVTREIITSASDITRNVMRTQVLLLHHDQTVSMIL